MIEENFEEYFKRRLKEGREKVRDLPIETLRDIYRQEYEFKKNRPSLNLKLKPQKLNHEMVTSYLPEKWEMPREGKLLYSDEEIADVLKLIVYNLGVEKTLDSIPRSLIEQYLHKSNAKK